MAQQRLYGVFWDEGNRETAKWAMTRNRREAERHARSVKGYVTAMPLPDAASWDAPTFRTCSELIADYREHSYRVVWSPEGKTIAVVSARNTQDAKRLGTFGTPYRKYLGEVYAEQE